MLSFVLCPCNNSDKKISTCDYRKVSTLDSKLVLVVLFATHSPPPSSLRHKLYHSFTKTLKCTCSYFLYKNSIRQGQPRYLIPSEVLRRCCSTPSLPLCCSSPRSHTADRCYCSSSPPTYAAILNWRQLSYNLFILKTKNYYVLGTHHKIWEKIDNHIYI